MTEPWCLGFRDLSNPSNIDVVDIGDEVVADDISSSSSNAGIVRAPAKPRSKTRDNHLQYQGCHESYHNKQKEYGLSAQTSYKAYS